MTEHFTELHRILQFRLAESTQSNPQFSLRALARKLNLSPSHLSRVLRGEKGFSYQSALRLVRELELSPEQTARILENYSQGPGKKATSADPADRDQRAQEILEVETFRLISDWYHFPLLELIRTKEFQSNEEWIAKRLGVSPALVSAALERLEKLGLISIKNKSITLKKGKIFKTSNDIQSLAIRKHHTQMLQKATEALAEQDPIQREFQALNLNFNPRDLKNAKKEIRDFVQKFNRKFSKKSGEEVFQLNMQFFSLTKENT